MSTMNNEHVNSGMCNEEDHGLSIVNPNPLPTSSQQSKLTIAPVSTPNDAINDDC